MARNDIHGLAGVIGEAADALALTPARELHQAIADRAFPRVGAPAKVLHDMIAGTVHTSVRFGVLGGAAAVGLLARSYGENDFMNRTPKGRQIGAAASALIGDRLEERGNTLVPTMAIRKDCCDLEPSRAALAEHFATATPRIVFLIHGLGETERIWSDRFRDGLAAAGATVVELAYNTGLPVEVNGERLDLLVSRTVREWPVRAEEVALVGHSLGGLVARAGVLAAVHRDAHWVRRLQVVAALGTPHHGAPMARGAARLVEFLGRWPEANPIGNIIERRSQGIRDLEEGLHIHEREPRVPRLNVAATIAADPGSRLGRIIGDLLVTPESAHGGPPAENVSFGGLDHFGLTRDPRVLDAMLARAAPTAR